MTIGRPWDYGKYRQFYQILTAFIPGQTYNYSPIIRDGRRTVSPNLTVKTTELQKLDFIGEEKDSAIRYWSGNGILASINTYSGRDVKSFNLIGIKPFRDQTIRIILDVFPKTYTIRAENDYSLTWNRRFLDNSGHKLKKTNKAQAQFVFCDNTGNYGIHDFRIRNRDNVLLASAEEENWANQRILVNGHAYPISAAYSYNTDYEHILKDYISYPSDWKFKPVLSSSLIVFMPVSFSDVFYPSIEKPGALFEYAITKKGIRLDELQGTDKVGINAIKALLDTGDRTPLEEVIKKLFSAALSEKILSVYGDLAKDNLKEEYKLSRIEQESSARKKDSENHEYFDDYGLSSVTYLEPLECVNACIGWITGKTVPGVGKDHAVLRPITVEKHPDKLVFDPLKHDWNVIYTITKSEGILFRFAKTQSFETKHAFAHLLLKVAPKLSGIEEGQLAEQIFEWANAVLIYSNEPGEFRTYGLKHVFENSLKDMLEAADEFVDCPFEDEKEGCYYCLHQPVVCSLFNAKMDKFELRKLFKNKATV